MTGKKSSASKAAWVAARVLFTLMLVLAGPAAYARIVIDDGGVFRVGFTLYSKGGMAEGALHGSAAPLAYVQNGEPDDVFWKFRRHADGAYSMCNMKTGRYVSLGSVSAESQLQAVLTDSLEGDSSLWRIDETDGVFIASNVADTLYRLRVFSTTSTVGVEKTETPDILYADFKLYTRHGEVLLSPEERSKFVASYCDVLTFNGARPVYDKLNKVLLLPVDDAQKDQRACHLLVNYAIPEGMQLYLNGSKLQNGRKVSVSNNAGGRRMRLTLKADTGVVAESELTMTFMPVIEITGSGFAKYSFTTGTCRITDGKYTSNNDSLYVASIRYRGNSTAGMQKKGYSIKLMDGNNQKLKRSFHGLRSDNYWVFDPMSVDHARMRNPASFLLWNKYARDCYYADDEPERQKASRGFFAEVLLNGSYVGIYNVMEKSDRQQFQLKKEKTADDGTTEVRGVLYKGDGWSGSIKMTLGYNVPASDDSKIKWDLWKAMYPDIEEGQKFDWSPLVEAVKFVCTSSDIEVAKKVWTYFDEPVMTDYYLLIELMEGYDNMGKNMLFMAHNIKKSRMLTVAPWDMDGTWGREWSGAIRTSQAPDYDIDDRLSSSNGLYGRLLSAYPGWKTIEAQRYAELRGTYFSQDSLLAIFNGFFDLFAASGADAREQSRWSGADGITLDFAEERTYLNDWIPKRLAALDEKFGYDASGVAFREPDDGFTVKVVPGGLSIRTGHAVTLDVFTVTGQMVRRLSLQSGAHTVALPSGIYIIGKKKYNVN